MDLTSLLTGATITASIIGTILAVLKNRREGFVSIRDEAKEERHRRIQAEEEQETLQGSIGDLELLVERLESDNLSLRSESESLSSENLRLKSVITSRLITTRLTSGNEEFIRVFNASRDLWLLSSPKDNGTVLLALGPWEKIGIDPSSLLGIGWRDVIAPRSQEAADRTEARALDSGGRSVLWYRGRTRDGQGAEWCLRWVYGRYNGETLAVATVIACEVVEEKQHGNDKPLSK